MSKDDVIETEGVIVEALPNAQLQGEIIERAYHHGVYFR